MRHSIHILLVLTVAAALAMPACAPASKTKPPPRAGESDPYDFRDEGQIPPRRDLPQEPDVVETPIEEADLVVEEADAPPDTATAAPTPEAVYIDGFRVQVFASGSRDVAEGARRTALARTGQSAYIAHEDGLYKVRVGNCRTRAQAEKLLEKVRSGYYKDAWIVATRIEVPPGTEGN